MPSPKSLSPECVPQNPRELRCDFRDGRFCKRPFSSEAVSTVDFRERPAKFPIGHPLEIAATVQQFKH